MKRRPIRIAAAAAAMLAAVSAVPAHAAKSAAPAKPVIVSIRRTVTNGKTGSFAVTVDAAQMTAGTRVSVVDSRSRRSCTIKAPSAACTISKVSVLKYITIKARATNASGSSGWSSSVNVYAKGGGFLRAGYSANGQKFVPATLSSTLKWKTLGTTSKWSKFQALKRSGVTSAGLHQVRPRVANCSTSATTPGGTTTTVAPAGEPCVIFQVSGVVGIALAATSSSCSGNVACAVAVAGDGTTSSLYAAGSDAPAVRDFYSAPNGRLYVVFNTPWRLVVGGSVCVLAEVNTDTGVPTCVDPAMTSIQTTMGNMYGISSNGNPPVQFDSAGNIYYMGVAYGAGFMGLTLRASANGTIRNIVNDNVTVYDFVVLTDGTVLVSGATTSTQARWLRKIGSTGKIENLLTSSQPTFLRTFADGNAYFGVSSNSGGGPTVQRYVTANGAVDSVPWITNSLTWITGTPGTNDAASVCPTNRSSIGAFCSSSGVYSTNFLNFGTTRTIGISTMPGVGSGSQMVQYWPTLDMENTSVANITIAYKVKDRIVLTGTNAAGKNIVSIYDPETNVEELILDGSNEVEVYSLAYVPATNKLMFNGLQFSDGKYVVSEVALP